jgi:hypothetical protein
LLVFEKESKKSQLRRDKKNAKNRKEKDRSQFSAASLG